MWKLGTVSFINTLPLIEGLDGRDNVQLRLGTPSEVAEWLRAGDVDAAIAPVAEWLRDRARYQIVSDACIGSLNDVASVRLISRVQPAEIKRLLLDPASMTSNLMARLILRERYEISPEIETAASRAEFIPQLMIPETEAAVVIGDLALQHHLSGACGDFPFDLDLGAEWRSMTGLPFVFAVWLAPQGADTAGLDAILSKARDAGMDALPQIAIRAARQTNLDAQSCERYLRNNLNLTLDEESRRGLALFAEKSDRLLEKEHA
jgi:chorismate dehydratase